MLKNKILSWQKPESILLVNQSLKKGGICVGSTDTVLGLLANVDKNSFSKLNEIKRRSSKSYIILIDSLEKLSFFTELDFNNEKLIKLIKKVWPGPVTLIFKSKRNLPDYLKSLDDTIAIRIPNHPGLLQLLTFFQGLFSTSANLSGEKIPETIEELDSHIVNLTEYIVVDSLEENHHYPIIPSTILDCTQKKVKVIREGAIPIKELEKIYEEFEIGD